MALRMRCAVEACRPADCARCLRLTGSGDLARASSRRAMRVITWIEFLDSVSAMDRGLGYRRAQF